MRRVSKLDLSPWYLVLVLIIWGLKRLIPDGDFSMGYIVGLIFSLRIITTEKKGD